MARRGIHNEGARVLQERLEGKAELDTDTARRLFTLICVLHPVADGVDQSDAPAVRPEALPSPCSSAATTTPSARPWPRGS